jgi:uroporphyrinogen-III decarboxylase
LWLKKIIVSKSKLAREKCGEDVILMGGVDTANTLFMQDAQTVKQMGEQAVAEGIQILAPGCAVAPGTPMENLKALVEVAKAHLVCMTNRSYSSLIGNLMLLCHSLK